MKYISFSYALICLVFLSACGLNTKFDDNDYRPVGASTPINSETHTLATHASSGSQKVPIEKQINNTEDSSSSSTRYVRPNSGTLEVKTATVKTVNYSDTLNTAQINTPQTTAVSGRQNVFSKAINDIFYSRYGDSSTIIKISKTVEIHCEKSRAEEMSSKKNSIIICDYQFPKHCGAHTFSLISHQGKKLLMFHDYKYQRNIIDTITDKKKSTPGLWDKDDYVSSERLTVNQLIDSKTINTNHLGWIMNVSNNEKTQLGRSYFSAINETSKCF